MFKYLKLLVYFFFSKIVSLSLLLSKIYKINLLYTSHYGYGDYVMFCNFIRKKVNQNNKIFCFSKLQYKTAKFFLKDEHIYKSLILLPELLSETHFGYNYLAYIKNFLPTNPVVKAKDGKYIQLSHLSLGTKETIEFIDKQLKKNKFSKKLKHIQLSK